MCIVLDCRPVLQPRSPCSTMFVPKQPQYPRQQHSKESEVSRRETPSQRARSRSLTPECSDAAFPPTFPSLGQPSSGLLPTALVSPADTDMPVRMGIRPFNTIGDRAPLYHIFFNDVCTCFIIGSPPAFCVTRVHCCGFAELQRA